MTNEVPTRQHNHPGKSFVLKSSMPAKRRPPLDLSARMAVCDANFLRLLKLMPDFSAGVSRTVLLPAVGGLAEGEHRLELLVVESFRYTSTVELVLVIKEAAPAWFKTPRLTVRLYHDAGTAEVVSYQDQRGFKPVYVDDDLPRYDRDEKSQINLFLADWLTLCLEGGLGFLTLPACLQPPQFLQTTDESSTEAETGN